MGGATKVGERRSPLRASGRVQFHRRSINPTDSGCPAAPATPRDDTARRTRACPQAEAVVAATNSETGVTSTSGGSDSGVLVRMEQSGFRSEDEATVGRASGGRGSLAAGGGCRLSG